MNGSDTTKAMERALELLADDSKRVCMGNIFQPFMSLQDAAERLAPFHVRELHLQAQTQNYRCCFGCALRSGVFADI